MGCCTSLQADQSIKITKYTQKTIKQGPGWICYAPCFKVEVLGKITLNAEQYLIITYRTCREDGDIIEHISGPTIYQQTDALSTVQGPFKKIDLNSLEYTIVTNCKTGNKHVVQGPQIYMPVPYEVVGSIEKKISLLNNQYILVTDNITGHLTIVSGPTIFTPGAFDKTGSIMQKLELSMTQYIICTDGKNGEKSVVEGPCLYTPKEYEQVSQILNKIILKNNQYCYVKELKSGSVSIVEGPMVFSLTPFQEASSLYEYVTLSYSQYTYIKHMITGIIRIQKGPARIVLSPFEEYILDSNKKEIREAPVADTLKAIHIRDKVSGTEELITVPQMYFPPSPNIEVIGIKQLITLAPFERMVIMDRDCNLVFKSGEDTPGFFLPPFCTILFQNWTTTVDGDKRRVEKFDCRYHDMDFKFSVRTNDNVEIIMMVNIYWTIKDFEKMIKSTEDPPEDICNQIRSQILNISSKMSTKEIMEFSSLDLVKTIIDQDVEFCHSRGINIVRINITEKRCADKEVDNTYRAVIEQKINRVKILEAQRGENDKRIASIEGQIAFETENFKLLEKKMANIQMENETNGKAEGQRLFMFFEGLGDEMNHEEKMKIFLELQRTERIKLVTSKVNSLYVTPQDVDFNLHRVENSGKQETINPELTVNKSVTNKGR